MRRARPARVVAVGIVGNTNVEGDKTFLMVLSSPTNALPGPGASTVSILNDDGLPGQVYWLRWDAIASPQVVNMPFTATARAVDAANHPATNFQGTVALSVSGQSVVLPANSGVFSNGVWSGFIAVGVPLTNAVLAADDGQGHFGYGAPFAVGVSNDISLSVTGPPDGTPVGAPLTYLLTVANTGPDSATGVTITDTLPASAASVSATASQGTCVVDGGVARCDLGVIGAGPMRPSASWRRRRALASRCRMPRRRGRAEPDGLAGNNAVITFTAVGDPAVSVADAAQAEGNAGVSNLLLTVSLAEPSGKPITVNYIVYGGTAHAGVDFIATNGTVSFAPGATNAAIAVGVIGNTNIERDKTFFRRAEQPGQRLRGARQRDGDDCQ